MCITHMLDVSVPYGLLVRTSWNPETFTKIETGKRVCIMELSVFSLLSRVWRLSFICFLLLFFSQVFEVSSNHIQMDILYCY